MPVRPSSASMAWRWLSTEYEQIRKSSSMVAPVVERHSSAAGPLGRTKRLARSHCGPVYSNGSLAAPNPIPPVEHHVPEPLRLPVRHLLPLDVGKLAEGIRGRLRLQLCGRHHVVDAERAEYLGQLRAFPETQPD